MPEPDTLIQYFWQIALILLVCLCGVLMVMVLRHVLRWPRPGTGFMARSRRSAKAGPKPDPWRASAERLVVPMPRRSDGPNDDGPPEAPEAPEPPAPPERPESPDEPHPFDDPFFPRDPDDDAPDRPER